MTDRDAPISTLTGKTRIAGVFGWPVDHSRSPRLHGYWLQQFKIDGAYIPFAAGAYQCIGKVFALMELTLITAVICARWDLRLVPGTEVREVASALIRPDRLPMTVHRRTPAERLAEV